MWFRREQKNNRNRRIGRGHVLDVKLRSDQVRAARVRLGTILFCIVFGTFFGLYLLWRTGEVLLDRFVYENPDFAIQNIEVQTDGVILPDHLRQWSNIKVGANLVGLNLAAVKQNLELVSAIQSVSVEKVLPHTVRIRVKERDPVAQVNVPRADAAGGFAVAVLHLDKEGVVMRPLNPQDCIVSAAQLNPQLPVISGVNLTSLRLGQPVAAPDAAAVQSALDLVVAFDHSPMAGLVDLRRVDINAPGVLLVTTGQGSQITFGRDNVELQLRRWRQIYDLGLTQQRSIATADLAVANNIPVRWNLADANAPVTARPKPKPVRTRRNNV